MSIRNKHLVWTEEAQELALTLEEQLKPIYESFKDKLTPEDFFYIVSSETLRYINIDILNQKRLNFEAFKKEKGIK